MRFAIVTCALILLLGPAAAASRDLVLIAPSERETLVENELPVLWKGASFYLAEWDASTRAAARNTGVSFELLARGFDADRELFIVEASDADVTPAEVEGVRILHRAERKWIVTFDSGGIPRSVPVGLSFLRVPRTPRGWIPRAPSVAYDCDYDPLIDGIFQRTEMAAWLDWIEKISGAEPMVVGGQESTALTRFSSTLFRNEPGARGFDYVREQVEGWHFDELVEEHSYDPGGGESWKNLVATIPGTTLPDEVVLITGHLDSINALNPAIAPGASDNGTGVATLLEAARILRQFRFQRTIQIVWFTGEEQQLLGSEAFVADYPVENFLGAVNMDLFGWDGDGDRCFEIHAGTRPDSIDVGNCFADTVESYSVNLSRDFLTTGATDRSDHASFWQVDVGAIEIAENFFNDNLPGGCVGQDAGAGYHTANDTIEANITPSFGFDIARTGLATIMAMALPVERCFAAEPVLTATAGVGQVELGWGPLVGAASYRIHRSLEGCSGQWSEIGETTGTSWTDHGADQPATHFYRVEAVDPDGFCVSTPSSCSAASPTVYHASGAGAEWIDVCASGGPGSGNGTIDPGEDVLVPVTLLNDGNVPLVGATGFLSIFHPSVAVIDPHGDWPTLQPGSSAPTEPNHFGIRVAAGLPCETTVVASLAVTHDQGGNTTTLPIPVATPLELLLLDESFLLGIPEDWTVVDAGSGGGAASTWTADNPGGRIVAPPFAPPFAIVDSSAAGGGSDQDESLITPPIDATGCPQLELEFSNQLRWWIGGQAERADVDVSTDGGDGWTNVLSMHGGHDGYEFPVTKSIDITAAASADPSNVQVRFHYHQAGVEWWWAIDNVQVRCTVPSCTPCGSAVSPPGEAGAAASLELRLQDGQIVFKWDAPSPSCEAVDHALYRGDLTQLTAGGYSHDAALTCSTGGTSFAVELSDPALGAVDYFLVVSDNGIQEGSYGRDGGGAERPASSSACHPAQNLAACGF